MLEKCTNIVETYRKHTMKNTILDLGCGTGNELLKFYGKFNVVGIDLDPENIKICQEKMPNGSFEIGDISKTDFSKFSNIKKVICTEVLEHIENWQEVISNLENLTSGTKLYITVPYFKSEEKLLKLRPNYWLEIGHIDFFNGSEIKKGLQKAGFKNISTERHNAALYFELKSLFKRNAKCLRNTYYEQILPLPLTLFYQLFRPNLFQTKLKYLFPIWIFTLPLGFLLDKFWGAGIRIRAEKKS